MSLTLQYIARPEPFDSPLILSLSKDEQLAQDVPAEGRAQNGSWFDKLTRSVCGPSDLNSAGFAAVENRRDGRAATSGVTRPRNWRRVVTAVGFAWLAVSLTRTAWISDDAYISFRTADNIIHGYGPVWNTAERVQAFTHPLWLALCTVSFAITHDTFYTAIALSAAITLLAIAVLVRLTPTAGGVLVGFAVLLSSKAFIDYSTSGLENTLSHALVLVFLLQWWDRQEDLSRLRRLSFLAGLCVLNRMDLGLLVLPPLGHALWRQRSRAALAAIFVGMLPAILWFGFATFYYGTPFPNTAYAKLNSAMTLAVRAKRGFDYVMRTLTSDPATLPAIALALVVIVYERRRDWPLAVGIVFTGLYVLWIGGDFMMGRFFSAPLVVSVALLGRAAWVQRKTFAVVAAAALAGLGLSAPWEPAIVSGYGYAYADNLLRGRTTREPSDGTRNIFVRQVVDERRMYSEFASFLKAALHSRGRVKPDFNWTTEGLRLRAGGRQVVVHRSIGLIGFFAGPQVHIVDEYALSDPLLARIPAGSRECGPACMATATIGHFMRDIPEGYIETLSTGINRIADPDLAAYYEPLHEIVAGPLWSTHRIVTIARFLGGRYDHYLASYLARRRADL
jgi:arabinofuranosyltransferase